MSHNTSIIYYIITLYYVQEPADTFLLVFRYDKTVDAADLADTLDTTHAKYNAIKTEINNVSLIQLHYVFIIYFETKCHQ